MRNVAIKEIDVRVSQSASPRYFGLSLDIVRIRHAKRLKLNERGGGEGELVNSNGWGRRVSDGCAPDLFGLRANRGEVVSWATDKIPAKIDLWATIGEGDYEHEGPRACFENVESASNRLVSSQHML